MIKTIGDEVMVVGSDAGALVDWAVGFQELYDRARRCRGSASTTASALYRDGDYYGRAVNLAARVGARAAGGEVLVTRAGRRGGRLAPRVRAASARCKLKGFNEPTELFLARPARR